MKEKDLSKLTAVALEYNPDEDAPKVVASGKGALAQKILEKGKESGVPVHKDDKLANTLSKLEIMLGTSFIAFILSINSEKLYLFFSK